MSWKEEETQIIHRKASTDENDNLWELVLTHRPPRYRFECRLNGHILVKSIVFPSLQLAEIYWKNVKLHFKNKKKEKVNDGH